MLIDVLIGLGFWFSLVYARMSFDDFFDIDGIGWIPSSVRFDYLLARFQSRADRFLFRWFSAIILFFPNDTCKCQSFSSFSNGKNPTTFNLSLPSRPISKHITRPTPTHPFPTPPKLLRVFNRPGELEKWMGEGN